MTLYELVTILTQQMRDCDPHDTEVVLHDEDFDGVGEFIALEYLLLDDRNFEEE